MRWKSCLTAITLTAVFMVPSACDRSPKTAKSDNVAPEDAAEKARLATTQPAPPSLIDTGASPLPGLIARANAGDVSAMVALGRAYEALANPQQARQWYEKAAKAGDTSAKESLRMMDAAARAATQPDQSTAPTKPTTSDTVATTAPAVDPAHLSWDAFLGTFDHHDFVTAAKPEYRNPKKPDDPPIFIGISTAPDKTMVAAAKGTNEKNIDDIRVAIRVRNKEDPASNKRVQQCALIARAVTGNNVSMPEFYDWTKQYLLSGQKSEQFRNGWSITISGTQGEKITDSKEYLGEMVLLVLKK